MFPIVKTKRCKKQEFQVHKKKKEKNSGTNNDPSSSSSSKKKKNKKKFQGINPTNDPKNLASTHRGV